LRKDGSGIYLTSDLPLFKFKQEKFKPDLNITLTASEQDVYFKQLFLTLKLLDFKWASNLTHLGHGFLSLPEGTMSSRTGVTILADDLINEMTELSRQELLKRYSVLENNELSKRSKIIAIGALKFFILKFDFKKDLVFNKELAISFEGETGPYLQYSFARIQSILKKAKAPLGLQKFNAKKLDTAIERKLVLDLLDWPETLKKSGLDYSPHLICNALLELAHDFNSFYHSNQVLAVDLETKNARLELIKAVAQELEIGLKVLGIQTLNEM